MGLELLFRVGLKGISSSRIVGVSGGVWGYSFLSGLPSLVSSSIVSR